MSFNIRIANTQYQYSADADTSILQAALDAKLLLPYSCKDGACGTCKGRIIEGQIDHGKSPESTLPAEERDAGMALFCCAKACSDLVIEARDVRSSSDIPLKKLPCRVNQLEKLADDVMRVQLRMPANDSFKFLAGQYIDFLLLNGQRRSFSIATAPHQTEFIELHIRRIPNGQFTQHVFEKMKERDILRFEGPLGGFYLREPKTIDPAKPIIFIAGGTGFAPIKGIIEDCIHKGLDYPMTLYWGARNYEGLYLHELAQEWQRTLPQFKYVPVISDTLPEGWSGRSGFVHAAVMEDWPNLSDQHVYACGAPAMIDAARQGLTEHCALAPEDFFADAFLYANELAN